MVFINPALVLGGGALAKNLKTTCDKKLGSNIFMVDKI